jgi:hypothetical protein
MDNVLWFYTYSDGRDASISCCIFIINDFMNCMLQQGVKWWVLLPYYWSMQWGHWPKSYTPINALMKIILLQRPRRSWQKHLVHSNWGSIQCIEITAFICYSCDQQWPVTPATETPTVDNTIISETASFQRSLQCSPAGYTTLKWNSCWKVWQCHLGSTTNRRWFTDALKLT